MGLLFKHRIEFVAYERVGGLPTQQEVSKGFAWADIKTMKGNEYHAAALAGNVGKSRFIIRYRTDIKPSYEIKFKEIRYKIESIENDDENNRTMTLFVRGAQ